MEFMVRGVAGAGERERVAAGERDGATDDDGAAARGLDTGQRGRCGIR